MVCVRTVSVGGDIELGCGVRVGTEIWVGGLLDGVCSYGND